MSYTQFSSILERIIFAFLFFFFFQYTNAQEKITGALAGKIISSESEEPRPFVNILLERTSIGTVSNEKGEFILKEIPAGSYTVVFSSIGCETRKENIRINPNRTATLNVSMRESSVEMKEVEIVADARKKSLEDIRPSVVEVQPRQAKALPGAAEDVLRALQNVPGVIAPSDFRAALVVRGGNPDQNLIVMDGIEIFNPYRLYGLISMFNPETVSDIQLLTGGFPAKYGDRLSAVVDVVNKRGGGENKVNGNINASISNANIVLEGKTQSFLPLYWLVSARRTYYDLVLEPFAKNAGLVKGDVAFPNFSDIQGKFTVVPSSKHQVTFNGIASQDGVYLVSGSNKQTPDSVSIDNASRNDVAGAEWLSFPAQNFTSKFNFSWYRNTGVSDFGGAVLDPGLDRERLQNSSDSTIRLYNVDISSSFTFQKYSLKEEMLYQFHSHIFEFGISRDWLQNDLYWQLQLSPELRARFENLNVAVLNNFLQSQSYARDVFFVQDKWKMSESFSTQFGLRYNHFHILNKNYVEPRVNISYSLNPVSTFRAAFGLYYQSPGYEKLVDQNVFYSLSNATNLKAERAMHYILGYERWFSSEIFGKVETYYKSFDKLIIQEKRREARFTSETIPGEDSALISGWTTPHLVMEDVYTNNPINNAYGDAYGLEFYFEKKQITTETKIWGYVSYTLAWAQRNVYGVWRPLAYDQRHTINISANYKINNWLEVAVKWRYGTNFPYSPPVGIQPRIISVHIDSVIYGTHVDTTIGIIQTDRNNKVVFDIKRAQGSLINSRRLPPYHRLDIRATAYTKIWGLDWQFYLDVINVYNRTNILNYQFYVTQNLKFEKNPTSMFPILPTLGMSVKF